MPDEEKEEFSISLEHIVAGAVVANGGSLVLTTDDILSDEIVGKFIALNVNEGVVTVTLVDGKDAE
jgi:hypothetical protein